MQTQKRYTTSYTKRVDHEGGLHRPAQKLSEPTSCKECGAVYNDGRWSLNPKGHEDPKHKHWRPENLTTCPACKQIESGVVGGYVSLSGSFLKEHLAEIESLINHEAKATLEDSPLSRIVSLTKKGNGLTVETTTEHLAQRLGHALEQAYSGEISYDFSHENKVARVKWHRD